MFVQPYLFFNGRCEEAVTFYEAALGAKLLFKMRYNESPEPPQPGMVPAGFEDKIMHCSFKVGSTTIMASDGCTPRESEFKGFNLSIGVATEADAERIFNALAEGGNPYMPLTKTFWSPKFGMLADKFGINWMVSLDTTPE